MKLFSSKKSFEDFQPGDNIAVVGADMFDRQVFTYQDPVSFVAEIAKNDDQITGTNSNQEFMEKLARVMEDIDISIPHHNEEAFLKALTRAGIFVKASLN